MWQGPQAQTTLDRMQMLDRIVAALHARYGEDLLAIGLYGSLARGEDGPYSDIELFCVVNIPSTDVDYEWVYGAGKAEVNVFGPDVARARARRVEDDWALDQGQLIRCRPLYGDLAFFEELKQAALSPAKAEVDAMAAAMVVGELYEWMGKLRNAQARGALTGAAPLACSFVKHAALLLGLVHRRLYRTGGALMAESMELPDRPAGYDDLCRMVMAGELADPDRIASALEAVWAGLEPWLAQHGVDMSTATTAELFTAKAQSTQRPEERG